MKEWMPMRPPNDPVNLPRGFRAHVANIGIKDATPDFVVIASEVPCRSVAMFTRSLFAGPSVLVSRRNAAGNHLQAVVVVSKNANVATGAEGLANAEELGRGVAVAAGCDEEHRRTVRQSLDHAHVSIQSLTESTRARGTHGSTETIIYFATAESRVTTPGPTRRSASAPAARSGR